MLQPRPMGVSFPVFRRGIPWQCSIIQLSNINLECRIPSHYVSNIIDCRSDCSTSALSVTRIFRHWRAVFLSVCGSDKFCTFSDRPMNTLETAAKKLCAKRRRRFAWDISAKGNLVIFLPGIRLFSIPGTRLQAALP